MTELAAPIPYFGGKSAVAGRVWAALGNPGRYIEPFCGSAAVLLDRDRSHVPCVFSREVVNDRNGLIANLWRAIRADGDELFRFLDGPTCELDLYARSRFTIDKEPSLAEALAADPNHYDARIAAWYMHGMTVCIGNNFAAGNKGRPCMNSLSQSWTTRGRDLLTTLQARMQWVSVLCGDWHRCVASESALFHSVSTCGVFLDPPYSVESDRDMNIYAGHESGTVAHDVRRWCANNGGDHRLRIVLAGYEGEHEELETLGWSVESWRANGGMGNQGEGRGRANKTRERLWFSPHCERGGLFDVANVEAP